MTKTLESVSPIASVTMPGGVWTPTEFVIFEGASVAQLQESVRRLSKLNISSQWAFGDLGLALQDRKRREIEPQIQALREQADSFDASEPEAKATKQRLLDKAKAMENAPTQYTTDIADLLGVDDGHWRNCVVLARFYPPSKRFDTLYPHHHLIAMRAARAKIGAGVSNGGGGISIGAGVEDGGGAIAREWLLQADQERLKGPEMRRRVNVALATAKPADTTPQRDEYAALTACDEWAIGYRSHVPSLNAEQRQRLLTLMQGILDLASALRE